MRVPPNGKKVIEDEKNLGTVAKFEVLGDVRIVGYGNGGLGIL